MNFVKSLAIGLPVSIIGALVGLHIHAAIAGDRQPQLAYGGKDATPSTIDACVPPGQWFQPATHKLIKTDKIIETLATRPVVLLGESHTVSEHHRWQLHTLAALHGRNPNMVIAFETFPRRAQPVLDQWIRGELDVETFLEKTEWNKVWGLATEQYLPLFHFARINRIPMIAMNVDREVIAAVREKGLAGLPVDQREGVSNPAPAAQGYIKMLGKTYLQHQHMMHIISGEHPHHEDGTMPEGHQNGNHDPVAHHGLPGMDDDGFKSFVEAQTLWDRAMAEAIATARKSGGDPLVVGIVGRGHLQFGYGIPHQLKDLGIDDSVTLLPWAQEMNCHDLAPRDGPVMADAIFGIDNPSQAAFAPHGTRNPLRLGVQIEPTDNQTGTRVVKVMPGSVAETTGIRDGDIITRAAGLDIKGPDGIIKTMNKQAPGTWLPLTINRDGETMDLIAKFPPAEPSE